MELVRALPQLAAENLLAPAKDGKDKGKGKSISDFLGEQQAVAGLEIINKSTSLDATIAKIRAAETGTGGAGDLLDTKVKAALSDPEVAANLRAGQAAAVSEKAKIARYGMAPVLADAAADDMSAQMLNNGYSAAGRTAAKWDFSVARTFSGDGGALTGLLGEEGRRGLLGDGGKLSSEMETAIAQELLRENKQKVFR